MKKKFKSIAIYSSISSSKVAQIASQLEEIIHNLSLRKLKQGFKETYGTIEEHELSDPEQMSL